MVPSDDDISDASLEFRAAIDAAGPEPWARKGMTFPRGACGHAAELLGRYLIDRFGITPDYVNRVAYETIGGWHGSHAWLEWNGLTIDISGDQFGWAPVIVTRNPEFHGLGDGEDRHPVCLEAQRDWWFRECGMLWSAISLHLPVGADRQS
jgi:hypothetical protein